MKGRGALGGGDEKGLVSERKRRSGGRRGEKGQRRRMTGGRELQGEDGMSRR